MFFRIAHASAHACRVSVQAPLYRAAEINAEQAPKEGEAHGYTPLDVAYRSGHRHVINLLEALVWWVVSGGDGDGAGTRGCGIWAGMDGITMRSEGDVLGRGGVHVES